MATLTIGAALGTPAAHDGRKFIQNNGLGPIKVTLIT